MPKVRNWEDRVYSQAEVADMIAKDAEACKTNLVNDLLAFRAGRRDTPKQVLYRAPVFRRGSTGADRLVTDQAGRQIRLMNIKGREVVVEEKVRRRHG